jgi:superfamily II DNA or RNA helicase
MLLEHLALCQAPVQLYNNILPLAPDPALEHLAHLDHEHVVQLRAYQQIALMKMIMGYMLPTTGLIHPRVGGVLRAGTGAGKTKTSIKIAQTLRVPFAFFVNDNNDLLLQAHDEFQRALAPEPIGMIGGGKCDLKLINIVSVDSVHGYYRAKNGVLNTKGVPYEMPSSAPVVEKLVTQTRAAMFDECHSLGAKTPFECVSLFNRVSFMGGLSASPWRDDGMDILIQAACGPIVHTITASELIDLGWLVPPLVRIHEIPPPPGCTKDFGDFDFAYKTFIRDYDKRHQIIANIVNEHVSLYNRTVLVLVKHDLHGQALQKFIPKSTLVVGSRVSKTKRKKLWDQMRNREINVIIATTLADQGLDIPELDVVALAGGGKSSTRALQRTGRPLRTTDGKNRFDPTYNGKTVAFVEEFDDKHRTLEAHFSRRMAIYGTEPAFKYERIRHL